MGREFRGIKGEKAINAFIKAGGVKRGGKGDHINIKMPNGLIVTIPKKGELKVGLLKDAISKDGLTENEFKELL